MKFASRVGFVYSVLTIIVSATVILFIVRGGGEKTASLSPPSSTNFKRQYRVGPSAKEPISSIDDLRIILGEPSAMSAEGIITIDSFLNRHNGDYITQLIADLTRQKLSSGEKLLLSRALLWIAKSNPVAALEHFKNGIITNNIIEPNDFFAEMSTKNPEMFGHWLTNLEPKERDSNLVALAVSSLQHSPEVVIGVLKRMTAAEKESLMWIAVSTMATDDTAKARVLVESQLSGEDRYKALGVVAAIFSTKGDLTQAVKTIDSIESPGARASAFGELIASMTRDDNATDALKLLQNASPTAIGNILSRTYAFGQLIKEDPSECIKLLNKIVITQHNIEDVSASIPNLVLRSPDETADWIKGLEPSPTRNNLLEKVFVEMAHANLSTTMEIVNQMPLLDREIAASGIVSALAKTDIEAALKFATSESVHTSQQMLGKVVTAVATDYIKACTLIENPVIFTKLSNSQKEDLISNAASSWGSSNVEGTKNWVEQLPLESRPAAVGGLVRSWSKDDPVAASKWLSSMPSGAIRDAGARQIIDQIKATDPELASQWRNSLEVSENN